MVNNSKEKIANAFKVVVSKKNFAKATITDIAAECGIIRESFYYHFHDKYDVLKWVCENEIIKYIPEKKDRESIEKFVMFLIKVIDKDYLFYKKIVQEMGMEQIQKYVLPYAIDLASALVKQSMDDNIWKLRKEKEYFLTQFFANAFIAFFINSLFIHDEIEEDLIMQNFHFLFDQYFKIS